MPWRFGGNMYQGTSGWRKGLTSLLPHPGGGVKNVTYNFGCVKMQVLEHGEH